MGVTDLASSGTFTSFGKTFRYHVSLFNLEM